MMCQYFGFNQGAIRSLSSSSGLTIPAFFSFGVADVLCDDDDQKLRRPLRALAAWTAA